ncbi:MAG: zinc ABC transporter substrate-binding protein [Clostridia bacterium]|nr:zinc ABC transporter substrate-binding protein [Clostridia bacterium]
MKRIISLLLVCIIVFAAFTGCSANKPDSDKLNIVCTLFPQYDFARHIGNSYADISLLLPAGVESHAYEPTPTDIIKIGECDIFVYIGNEMETWVSSVMNDIDETKTTVINVTESLGLSVCTHSHDHSSHEESGVDPHIWTNVLTAISTVELIRDVMMEKDPENAAAYAENAGILLSRYQNLDKRIRETVNSAKRNEIVFAGRFALRNFTEEYSLDCITAFDSCTEESEPSAARIAEIIDKVNESEIPVIFYEELKEPKTAESISKDTGAAMRCFHSCHNLSREDFDNGETYLSLMEKNLEYLAEALN